MRRVETTGGVAGLCFCDQRIEARQTLRSDLILRDFAIGRGLEGLADRGVASREAALSGSTLAQEKPTF